MGTDTGIEWTNATWNPVRGCSRVSAGCENCYAEKVAGRFSGPGLPYEGLARIGKNGARWTGKVQVIENHLMDPLRWTKPRRIFVNSMSDLFHEGLGNEEIAAIFGIMASEDRHTFQVLTKRAARMRDWFEWVANGHPAGPLHEVAYRAKVILNVDGSVIDRGASWPLPNVWLGVSAEDQATADERIPLLLETPAAVRWVSAEPLLGSIDFFAFLKTPPRDEGLTALRSPEMPGLDWVVVGSESGPGARPMDLPWAVKIAEDCQEAGVPIFTKQIATPDGRAHGDPKGGDPGWWPVYMPREFPR